MTEYRTDINALEKSLSEKPVDPGRLVTENPTLNTQRLWEFLKSCKGKKYISGQQYLWEDEKEDIVYYTVTGKLPAIRGYDFMGISGLARGYDQIGRAYDWAKRTGGILTMCWHWNAPDDMEDISKRCSFYYKTTGYDHKTSFDIIRAMQEGTPENRFVIEEIDLVAGALKMFEQADIPVIWRPLHEANGNWFWWGNRGEESVAAYKKLWYTIFDRFMNHHKLKNLIWVWNGQSQEMAVSPNSFDIAGEDIYPEQPSHASQIAKYREVSSYTAGKLITLSECGSIPDPEEMQRDGAEWLWWLPWWGSFVYDCDPHGRAVLDENGMPRPNPKYMDEQFMKRVFTDPRVVTLSDLPWYDNDKKPLPIALRHWLDSREK
ncbi:MAG: glycosyl hydrolase [Oscillospiraceae bacterium]